MGHSNISTTQIYAKVTDDKISEDMDRLIERRKTMQNSNLWESAEPITQFKPYSHEKKNNHNHRQRKCNRSEWNKNEYSRDSQPVRYLLPNSKATYPCYWEIKYCLWRLLVDLHSWWKEHLSWLLRVGDGYCPCFSGAVGKSEDISQVGI